MRTETHRWGSIRVPISAEFLGRCSTRRARIFNKLQLFKGKFCHSFTGLTGCPKNRRLDSARFATVLRWKSSSGSFGFRAAPFDPLTVFVLSAVNVLMCGCLHIFPFKTTFFLRETTDGFGAFSRADRSRARNAFISTLDGEHGWRMPDLWCAGEARKK
jgi:hypothetical protein